MYWIPKMHKNPTGACLIITSKICSTKQSSKSVSNVLTSYTPKLKIFKKNQNSTQIITSFGSYKILSSSFNQ